MQEVYRVSPRISSEAIDGEVMILDLETGHYYNLCPTGALIWAFLENGARAVDIVEGLLAHFEGEPEQVGRSVEKLLAEFKKDRLIAAVPDAPAREAPPIHSPVPRKPFAEPVLNKFTDLKELLLVDPIHEVDHAGWPRAKG
ncbi:MAG TPA: PqqD family protein [bacterium]|nr:PqqD family protein [bacterium]